MNSNASNQIKAMAFDMDGTLTPLRVHSIPDYLVDELKRVPDDIKLTLCTGRPFFSLEESLHKLGPERWDVISENGNQIRTWDGEKYELIHEVSWPKEPKMEAVGKLLKRASLGFGQVRLRNTQVTVAFYYLQWWPWLMTQCSKFTFRRVQKKMKTNGWDQQFKLQMSGIGNIVQIKEMNKGVAVQWWMKHHNLPLNSLLCFGDNPQVGGNDESMLTDERWRGVTVGNPGENAENVMDEDGNILQGPKAVLNYLKTKFHS